MDRTITSNKYVDFFVQQQGKAVSGILFAVLCLLVVITTAKGKNNRRSRRPPEPTDAWPIIGHLHLLQGNKLFHRVFGAMADKYGPIFTIRIGIHPTLVISNWETAKECFTTLDRVFPTRPKSLAVKIMGYDHTMFGFAPYGAYWREMRKLAVVELLSVRRLELLKHVRNTEVNFLMQELHQKWLGNGGRDPVLVEMKQCFGDMAMNIVLRMVAGKRYFGGGEGSNTDESRRCQKAMESFMHLTGLFLISDAVPILGWLDTIKGYPDQMKRTAKEIDSVFQTWVEEQRQKRMVGSIDESKQNIIQTMLSFVDGSDQLCKRDADTVIKSNCLSLILGGHDTNVVTLTWALALLLNNRHVLRKAQDELDVQIGRHRQVEESDIENLTYLQAIIKETMRLYPAAPLSVPREAMKDCTVAGFHVSAGTRLFVNLWKLHRDPRIWSDPLAFWPERFLTHHANLDVRGQDFQLLPFGSGRRSCPGITFALQVLHLTLARLLHSFELGTISDSLVDMTEGPGMTVPKATPLEVTLSPRLSSSLYK